MIFLPMERSSSAGEFVAQEVGDSSSNLSWKYDVTSRLRSLLQGGSDSKAPADFAIFCSELRSMMQDRGKPLLDALDELRCWALSRLQSTSPALGRLGIWSEILVLDLSLLNFSSEIERAKRLEQGRAERWARCFLKDLAQARAEIPGPDFGIYERMHGVVFLTYGYLYYERIRGAWERELELLGLEERRCLEKLAYDTISEIAAMSGMLDRWSPASCGEVSRDLKVIYHHALDAGSLTTLALLGSRGGLQKIMELSAAAESLRSEACGKPASEGLFRLLEASELYGRLGLETKVSRCLEQARKLAPELPMSDRSAAYLRIEHISRKPATLLPENLS